MAIPVGQWSMLPDGARLPAVSWGPNVWLFRDVDQHARYLCIVGVAALYRIEGRGAVGHARPSGWRVADLAVDVKQGMLREG